MRNVLYRTLAIIFVAAIIAAIGRYFSRLDSPNTLQIPMNTPVYPMLVDSTNNLITYDITDCRLDLACGQMPDTTNKDIILCVAAAFTGKCLDYFDHTNILGPHISQSVLYDGYTEDKDGMPFEMRYALFVWNGVDTQGNSLGKGFYSLPSNHLLSQVTKRNGMAFTQHWVIQNKEIFTPTIQPLERIEHFRSLCVKQNRVYVIANSEAVSYQEYLDSLVAYGVENALYMDMGAGWNHSFYRDASGQLHILHPKTHSYPTNWLVVYK